MIEPNEKSFHLAGVIPVAGQPLDFQMDWSDSLMPIAPDYTAVERSVMECAWAGCETIWIVCNDDDSPLIRYRIGDYVQDPVYVGRSLDPRPSDTKKPIPIFYVPVHPNDRARRDCLAWSVLYGASSSYEVSRGISKWTAPDKYYVSFPYGVYPVTILRRHRKEISSKKGFYLMYNDKSVADGEYLGFTFDGQDFIEFRKKLKEKATNMYIKGTKDKLPLEKRYSARHFTIEEVFSDAVLYGAKLLKTPWYYDISSWEKYCAFLGSNESTEVQRPNKHFLKYHEFNPMGVDKEECHDNQQR